MSNKLQASKYFSEEFNKRVVPTFLKSALATRTKSEYYHNVINLCDFLCKDFLNITKEDVEIYFRYLKEKNNPISDKALRVKKASFITFEKFAKGKEWSIEDSVFFDREINTTSDDINADKLPSNEEIEQLLQAAGEDTQAYIILLILTRMALTVTKVITIRKEQVRMDKEGNVYFYLLKKDKSTQKIAVPNDIKQELIKYCNSINTEYLFTNKKGKPFNRKAIFRMFQKYRTQAGIDTKCSARDVRNLALLEQLHAGASKEEVARYADISEKRVTTLEQNTSKIRLCPPEYVTVKKG